MAGWSVDSSADLWDTPTADLRVDLWAVRRAGQKADWTADWWAGLRVAQKAVRMAGY